LLAFFLPLLAGAQEPKVVSLDSPAPLLKLKVMVKAGSAMDPAGLEGLAYLTARLLIEGGYGDPKKPVTKEQLAEITRPWGEGAYPGVLVHKETTTFSMTVPREVFGQYLERVLLPMLARPLFASAELDRVRKETLEQIRSSLRFQQIEMLGLLTLDNVIHNGTAYAHLPYGTVQGLEQITADDVKRFYRAWYQPATLTAAVSTKDTTLIEALRQALSGIAQSREESTPLAVRAIDPPAAFTGRHLTIVSLPQAIASGIHAGFPIALTRAEQDYWPLYVGNVWFGTHRDSFSHLYQVIREERGYNYGDYSYIEHFEERPRFLFPPTNVPRRYQYFSIWIRTVAHEYVHHLLKALTWELENFTRNGLTPEQVAAAKNKARVLYLSLAENVERLVGYKLDDEFYGLDPGYIDHYLSRIDAVTPEAVNAAIRKHLQAKSIQYVIITDQSVAEKLADDIANNRHASGKTLKDYQIESEIRDGVTYWMVPESRLETLSRDAIWAAYSLDIPRSNIRIVKAEQMFETAAVPQ